MNQAAVLAAIGVVVAAVILWPLIRRSGPAAPRARGDSPGERLVPPDELAELEMDRAMGRIGEPDYQRLKARLTDAVPIPTPPAVVTAAAGSRADALVRRWLDAPRPTCPTCGERPEPEARYCSTCGAGLGA